MTQAVRDIVLLAQRDLDVVRELLQAEVTTWAAHWLPGGQSREGGGPTVAVLQARAGEGHETAIQWANNGHGFSGIWVDARSQAHNRVADALLGCDSPCQRSERDWALALADKAIEDLCLRIAACLGNGAVQTSARTPEQYLSAYTGAMLAEIDALSMGFLLARGAYEGRLPKLVPKPGHVTATAPLLPILAARPLAMRLSLGDAEVSLQDLLSLSVGDVIRIGPRLTESLAVELNGQPTALKGEVGCQGQHVALRLVKGLLPISPPSSNLLA